MLVILRVSSDVEYAKYFTVSPNKGYVPYETLLMAVVPVLFSRSTVILKLNVVVLAGGVYIGVREPLAF